MKKHVKAACRKARAVDQADLAARMIGLVAAVAPEFERTGGHYLDDCREAYTVPDDAQLSSDTSHGVKRWALDQGAARELWTFSLDALNALNP